MRESIQGVLRDGRLVTLALAVALGLSLYSVAEGMDILVTTILREYPPETGGIGDLLTAFNAGALTWRVGDRFVTFGALVGGLVELMVVLAAAAFVYRWRERDASPSALPDAVGDDGREDFAGPGVSGAGAVEEPEAKLEPRCRGWTSLSPPRLQYRRPSPSGQPALQVSLAPLGATRSPAGKGAAAGVVARRRERQPSCSCARAERPRAGDPRAGHVSTATM